MGLDQSFNDIHSVIPALKYWKYDDKVSCGPVAKPTPATTPASAPATLKHLPHSKFHGVSYSIKCVDAMFSKLPEDILTSCLDKLTPAMDVDRLCADARHNKTTATADCNPDALKTFFSDFCSSLGAENLDPNVPTTRVSNTQISPSPCSSPLLTGDLLAAKPTVSYLRIIAQSILQSADGRVLLNDIYAYVLRNYPYYEHRKGAWRNSIRHNLSVSECFAKDGRAPTGRGHYWRIHEHCAAKFAAGDFSRRSNPRNSPHLTTPLVANRPQNGGCRPGAPPSSDKPCLDGEHAQMRMLTGGKRTAQVYGDNRCEFRGHMTLLGEQQQQQAAVSKADFKHLQYQYQPMQNIQQSSYSNNFAGFNPGATFVRC